MINYKSEKGGVTIYVLSAMVILIIALISIYVSLNNKQMAQLDVAEQIKSLYEEDINNMNEIYDNLVS